MCRLDSFPHALLPIRRKISTTPPRCSPDTRLSINREDVYPENNKVAMTKSCVRSEESISGEMNPIYTYSGCPWITLDNSKESNYKYANECIFINGIFRTGDAYGLRNDNSWLEVGDSKALTWQVMQGL